MCVCCNSLLDELQVTDAQRNDSVWLRVAGARDYTGGEAGARELALQPGDNYAKVSDAAEGIPKAYPSALSPQPSALSSQPHWRWRRPGPWLSLPSTLTVPKVAAGLASQGWAGAYVVKVDARSLAALCEDIGTPAQNDKFNQEMHTVLGIAEQVRFCDAKVNPRYTGRQDDYKNPINCTWGFHRPPKMGAEGACLSSLGANLQLRNAETKRDWKINSREAWSTRDRAGYLYRNYM